MQHVKKLRRENATQRKQPRGRMGLMWLSKIAAVSADIQLSFSNFRMHLVDQLCGAPASMSHLRPLAPGKAALHGERFQQEDVVVLLGAPVLVHLVEQVAKGNWVCVSIAPSHHQVPMAQARLPQMLCSCSRTSRCSLQTPKHQAAPPGFQLRQAEVHLCRTAFAMSCVERPQARFRNASGEETVPASPPCGW